MQTINQQQQITREVRARMEVEQERWMRECEITGQPSQQKPVANFDED